MEVCHILLLIYGICKRSEIKNNDPYKILQATIFLTTDIDMIYLEPWRYKDGKIMYPNTGLAGPRKPLLS